MAVRVEEDCSGTAHLAHLASATQVTPGDAPWGPDLAREWLVTDGRGGYASGTVAGVNTRRYHGLLVAPLAPPLGRTLLVARLEERLTTEGQTVSLSSNEFEDGTVHPHGYRHLERFSLERGVPTWRYRAGGALLQKQIWMPPGQSATCVRYTLGEDAPAPATLAVLPLCTYRDFHQETEGNPNWRPGVRRHEAGLTVQAFAGATPYHLLVSPPPGRAWSYDTSGGQPGWWWRFLHRGERERGLECVEDLYGVGAVVCELAPGESLLLTATIEGTESRFSLEAESPDAPEGDEFVAQLRRAASQFLVARPLPDNPDGPFPPLPGSLAGAAAPRPGSVAALPQPGRGPRARSTPAGAPAAQTVIAGYHWFGDWGRDTMIALPGLAAATGRWNEAGDILRAFARYVERGLLPNRFPDSGAPLTADDYNTIDATLWYVRAVDAIDRHLGGGLAESLLPVLAEILDWHIWGTSYRIRVDPQDGLLRTDNGQLTWMDVRVGEWVVTPRAGKPVEVAALWHHALGLMEGWCRRSGRAPQATYYAEMRKRAASGFAARFWYADGGYLYDVVDGPAGDDHSLRPNQVLAAALPDCPLTAAQRRAVVDVAVRRLWTPRGLRTLDRDDPRYAGRYAGAPPARDAAYHRGTAWPWLLGPLVDAHLLAYGDRAAARALVAPLRGHLFAEAGCGSISEVFDGDAPHAPGGCIAQAWSVAEVFRAWLATEPAPAGAPEVGHQG